MKWQIGDAAIVTYGNQLYCVSVAFVTDDGEPVFQRGKYLIYDDKAKRIGRFERTWWGRTRVVRDNGAAHETE